MKKYDSMWIGLAGGLLAPLLLFVIYFSIRDPGLHIADQVNRMAEANVLAYYVSLCALANLLLFFVFLRMNAERAARGVLGATILYAFTVIFLKLT
jgi:hypothetical protein